MFQIEKTPDSFGKPCVRVSARGLNSVILLVKAEGDDNVAEVGQEKNLEKNLEEERSYFVVQCGAGKKVRGRLIWDGGAFDEIDKEDIVELALREAGLDASALWEDITAIAC